MNRSSNPTSTWLPIAAVALTDRATRQRIVGALRRAGWAVISRPSGYHLIQAIAGIIDGHQAWLRPNLIIVDAHARGCAGTTIAAGLRDLGIAIPIVVATPGTSAEDIAAELARRRHVGNAIDEQDDGLGALAPQVSQRASFGLEPRERRGPVGELDDDHAFVLPYTLERLDGVAADQGPATEGRDRGRRLGQVLPHRLDVTKRYPGHDGRAHAGPEPIGCAAASCTEPLHC